MLYVNLFQAFAATFSSVLFARYNNLYPELEFSDLPLIFAYFVELALPALVFRNSKIGGALVLIGLLLSLCVNSTSALEVMLHPPSGREEIYMNGWLVSLIQSLAFLVFAVSILWWLTRGIVKLLSRNRKQLPDA